MVGQTISHYRITSQLGAGGMGVVYAAEDQRLGRSVALKFVPEDVAKDHQAIERLRIEARTASGLNHPNICTIHDIGEHEGRPFIVMELLKGQTLRERLADGPLKIHETIDMGIQIADALDSAHQRDIVHRDIKPANLFLIDRGTIKILDFGLAKLVPRQTAIEETVAQTTDLTGAGVTLGTVAYMSPEQVMGERLDGRADLFSFGVVLYECVTGHQPFKGKTSAMIFAEILHRGPAAPVIFNAELPLRLQEIVTTCLEKDRELRYQDAAGLRADLKRLKRDLESGHTSIQRIEGGMASQASTAHVSHSHQPVTVQTTAPPVAEPTTKRATNRGPLVGAAIVAATLVVAASYVMWRRAPVQNSLQEPQPRPEATGARPDTPAANARLDETVSRARALLAAGDTGGATAALDTARAIDPNAAAVVELGQLVDQFKTQTDAARRAVRPAPAAEAPVRPPPPSPAPPRQASSAPEIPSRSAPAPVPATAAPPSASAPPPVTVPAPATSATAPAVLPERPAPSPGASLPVPTAEAPVSRETAPPAAQPSEDDESAIRRVVATYARAIETKDVGLFRSVKPNLSSEEQRRIEEGFRAVTSQRVSVTVLSIDRRGQQASVRLRRRDTIDAGGRQQTTESQQTMTLVRAGAGWVIGEIGR